MPIYEFYCRDCHTLFNFFSRRVDTEKRPSCPRCRAAELERRVSPVALLKRARDGASGERQPGDDDAARLEQAMASMAGDFENLPEDDPRAIGRMLRRVMEAAGVRRGSGMEEALRRLECGEDPDRIEAELADVLENEDPLHEAARTRLDQLTRLLPPRVDETLYEL